MSNSKNKRNSQSVVISLVQLIGWFLVAWAVSYQVWDISSFLTDSTSSGGAWWLKPVFVTAVFAFLLVYSVCKVLRAVKNLMEIAKK